MQKTNFDDKLDDHEFQVVLSSDMLVQQTNIKNYIKQIRSLTALPDEHFSLFYIEPIKKFLSISQYYNTNEIDLRFKSVIAALKLRRSIILPSGTDSENISNQKDLWTYVVFVIALMYGLSNIINKTVIYKERLIEKNKIYKWLPFNQAITPGYYFTTLENITISPYATSILLPSIFNTPCLTWLYRDVEAFNSIIELIVIPNDKTSLGKLFYTSHNISKKTISKSKTTLEKKKSDFQKGENAKNKMTKKSVINQDSVGEKFYDWLVQKATKNNGLLVDYICNTLDGPALIIPDVFQYYAKSNNADWQLVEKEFMSLNYHDKNIQKISLPGQTMKNVIFLTNLKL